MLTNIYSSWIGVKELCNYKQIFVEYFCNFSIWSGFNPLIMIFLQCAMANSTCILFMSQGFTSLHVPLLCKYLIQIWYCSSFSVSSCLHPQTMIFRSNSVNTTQYNLQQQLRMCLTSVDHKNIIIIRWRVDDFSVRPLPVQVIIEPTPSGFKGLGMTRGPVLNW